MERQLSIVMGRLRARFVERAPEKDSEEKRILLWEQTWRNYEISKLKTSLGVMDLARRDRFFHHSSDRC
jgi:hypothetical protein